MRAVTAQVHSSAIQTWLGITSYANQRFEEAIAPLEWVAKVNPENWSNATYLLDSYEFEALLEDLMVRFEREKIGAELKCRKAALAEKSCAAGETRCCE